MAKSLQERFKEILLQRKILTGAQLSEALKLQRETGLPLRKILLSRGFVVESDLVGIISEEMNIPPISISRYKIDPAILDIIPEKMARQYMLLPVSKMGETLTVAMSDPLNVLAIDDIKLFTKYQISPVMAAESEMADAINRSYKHAGIAISKLVEEAKEEGMEVVEDEKVDLHEVEEESKRAPIVKMVDLMLTEALKRRASDLHIEPQRNSLRVRYRIDGNLQEALSLPKSSQNPVIARLRIISGLDITESRVPQDGRFKMKFEDREIDFRVSVLPVQFGGKVVLRALDKSSLAIGLEKLGFLPEPLVLFRDAVRRSHGMILVTGPTGSGKSTTLYSVLQQLNTPDKNIITIEDPVEYQVEGITQIQVRPDIGLTFASGLRSLLRQAPDIIMVGEIRDAETADIAIKASLTGQLVFSTLHTNDAAGAITRLIDMGVEPFLIASSLIMVCAQRLCRKICPSCREAYPIPQVVLDRVGLKVDASRMVFYRGKGCAKCNQSGYYGRLGILEVLLLDDTIRDMIIKRTSSTEIKDYAVAHGMVTLRDSAMKNVIMGLTTLEEALRVTTEG